MLQIAKSDGVKPEYVVQSVVKTGRNQQTVQECIDTCAYNAELCNAVAKCNECTEQKRPYEQQNSRYQNGNHACNDGNAALAAEECQPVRKLRVLELVVAQGTDDTGKNSDERVCNLVECKSLGCAVSDRRHDGGNNSRRKKCCHHQPGCKSCNSAGSVVLLGHADADTDCEQNRHVIDESSACLHEEQTDQICRT